MNSSIQATTSLTTTVGETQQRGGLAKIVDAVEAIQQVIAKFLFRRYRARRGDARQLVGGVVFVGVGGGKQDGFNKFVDVVVVVLNATVVGIGLGDDALCQVIVITGARL